MNNKEIQKITFVGKKHVINYSTTEQLSNLVEGVTMVLPKKSEGKLACAVGTKFYLNDGTEIKDVHSFEVKPTGCDNILTITLTLPLALVAYGE